MKSFKLNGKSALVTGAGQGLGKEFALTLARAGADVAVVDIVASRAEKVASEIRALGCKSLAITADLSCRDDAYRMVDETVAFLGTLTVAVNNVGVAIPIKGAEKVTEQEWDIVMNTNLKGTFFCCQAEANAMIPEGYGKIINIASMCGHIVWPEPQALYSISKAGIIHLSRCLVVEWISCGIRVNSISPGVTRTPDLFPEVVPVFLQRAPIDHIAEVEDMQGALLYLASPLSDFMVGQEIIVDGGYTLV